MVELRKRVLSSGFVVLEYRITEKVKCQEGVYRAVTDWMRVPYVDENGDPLNNYKGIATG